MIDYNYDNGGFLHKGWTEAVNNTGYPIEICELSREGVIDTTSQKEHVKRLVEAIVRNDTKSGVKDPVWREVQRLLDEG